MLKENPRYDYAEMQHAPAGELIRTERRKRADQVKRRLSIPVSDRAMREPSLRVPMQEYLAQRFAHSGRRHDPIYKALRAENQRRHDLCVARGNVQLSRTSGDWHPITAAEIAAIKAAEEAASQNSKPPRNLR